MPNIIDISISLSPQTVVWADDPPLQIERVLDIRQGADYNLSRLAMSVHNGTHIDAPSHFLAGGKTVDQIDLCMRIGPAQILEIPPQVKAITAQHLQKCGFSPGVPRVLLKTAKARYWRSDPYTFHPEFTYLAADGARLLVDSGIKLVGIDYLSISSKQGAVPIHQMLLSAGVIILETIDLSAVEPGTYSLYCLPLKLLDVEAAPARAVLLKE